MTDTTAATTTTAAATTTAADTTTTTAATTAPWHGLTDADAAAYIDNKGWKSPADIVKSYQGAEKLIGRDPNTLVQLPRADDPDGQRALFQKLGLPESPDKYDMTMGLPQGAKPDETFSKSMQAVFHKAGLTDGQAKALVGDWNAMQLAATAQATKDYELNVQADKQALLDKWKGGHDRMMNAAKTTAQGLGFTPELIDAIERQVGYAKTYEMLAAMGTKLGEDGLVIPGKTPGFENHLTPAEAKTQLDGLRMDGNHTKALMDPSHPGHKAAKDKETKLFTVMYPQ